MHPSMNDHIPPTSLAPNEGKCKRGLAYKFPDMIFGKTEIYSNVNFHAELGLILLFDALKMAVNCYN